MSQRSRQSWRRRGAVVLWCALAALAVSACAGQDLKQAVQNPDERLMERVRQYWEARVRDDIVEQYSLEEPWMRERVSLTAYARGKGATKILEYEIKGVEGKSPDAVAKLHLKYKIMFSKLAHLPLQEVDIEQSWVWVDGEWYLQYRSAVGPLKTLGGADLNQE